MVSQSPGEHLPLREDHSRTTDSNASSRGSTSSSLSIAPGPGALAARFLKWAGNAGLDSLQALVIHRRLVVIKQTVRDSPNVFMDPLSSQDVHNADRIYDDLEELCRGSYPLNIQRKAARRILEISFLRFRSGQSDSSLDSWTMADHWNRWNALLKISTASLIDTKWLQAEDDPIMSMDVGLSSVATGNTVDTRSTIKSLSSSRTWTPGRLTQQRAVANVGVRTKLASIKRAVRKRPHIFTTAQGAHQMQEVDRIFGDLAQLTRLRHSLRTRREASRLVLEITVLISGPGGIISSRVPCEDDGVLTISHTLWDDLVTRSDVQSLLMLGRRLPAVADHRYIF